jgi:hypothetical protein
VAPDKPLLGGFALSLGEAFILFYAVLCHVWPKAIAADFELGSLPPEAYS